MDTSKLAPNTRRVWEFLAAQPGLAGFILIGGSALALRIGHRLSEDLDFVIDDRKLPRAAIDGLLRLLNTEGFEVRRDDDPAAYDEFLIAGLELHDYQQSFLIDGVKVSFFTSQSDLAGMLDSSHESLVRVASLPELFRTKALAAANRCLSRDWIDLYVLLKDHGFGLADFQTAFHRPGIHHPALAIDRAFQNLCRGAMTATDPGYEMLMPDPPSLEGLAQYFRELRDEYQTTLARESFQRQRTHDAE